MKVNSLLVRRIVCLLYIKVLPGFNQSESIVVISVTDAGLVAAEVPLIRFVLSTEIQAWGADKSAVIPVDVNESVSSLFNTSRSRQNGRLFADNSFQNNTLYENCF